MLTEIFGNYPQIKVLEYLLSNPFGKYTKQQIAVGSEISRITLNKFFDDILEKEIIIKEFNSKYSLNLESEIVRELNRFIDIQNRMEIEKQMKNLDEPYDELSESELNMIFDENAEDVDLNKLEREIASKEAFIINMNEDKCNNLLKLTFTTL